MGATGAQPQAILKEENIPPRTSWFLNPEERQEGAKDPTLPLLPDHENLIGGSHGWEQTYHTLTDRLHARANSRLFSDQPETKLDIRLAARLLKHLIETGVIYHPLELT